MASDSNDFALRQSIAAALREYLREASALPPAPPNEDFEGEGWFAVPPGPSTQIYGREPWTNMSNVDVELVGRAVVVSFQWRLDDDPDRSYVLPLLCSHGDAVTGSDSLITSLDFLLDSPGWPGRAHPIGGDVFVVVND